MSEYSILFCCMGNICRSPMAAGLFKQIAEKAGVANRIIVDSAGTHADFPDSPADPRARRALAERGIDISGHRARRVTRADFERFDLILVMDGRNYDTLQFVCPKKHTGKIGLLLDYAPKGRGRDVPDPFNADESAFGRVVELLEPAVKGLLEQVLKNF